MPASAVLQLWRTQLPILRNYLVSCQSTGKVSAAFGRRCLPKIARLRVRGCTQGMVSELARPDVALDDVFTLTAGHVRMTGIQALVRVTLDQRRLDRERGLRTSLYVSGYEGSPLGGLDIAMARARSHLDREGVIFRPGVNEELAATAVAGTQSLSILPSRRVDGVTGCWYGKSPGLDRAADAIRHGNLIGTDPLGGAVAWIGDDPASKSSTVPSSSISMCQSLAIPALTPGRVEDILRLGLHAVAMSRHAGLWSSMLIATDVADATDTVDLGRAFSGAASMSLVPRRGHRPLVPLPPANLDAETDLFTNRLARASEYARAAGLNAVTFEPAQPRIALVGYGLSYQAIVRSLQEMGIDEPECERLGLRLVQLDMPWPLERQDVSRFCGVVDTVLVIEDKRDFLESLIRHNLYGSEWQPRVLGKRDLRGHELIPYHGFVTADDVSKAIGRVLDPTELRPAARHRLQQLQRPLRVELPLATSATRTPYFCSGCPHNTSTRADADQLVGLGIGCHTMAGLDSGNRRGQITGLTQMGGEGSQWHGLAPFTDERHFIQNLGDGTFHHSGSLAIRAAVAAGVNMTYRLLYNDAVAMTGGQRPEGRIDVPALTRMLEAEGVVRTVVTTPEPKRYTGVRLASNAEVCHRDRFEEIQRELAQVDGVTVLLHDDRCAAEKRRMRKRGKLAMPAERVVINERVCEGCGDCGEKSTCLSLQPVETVYGRKTQIHQSSCNYDLTCLKGDCPSFLLVTPAETVASRPVPEVRPPTNLPTPTRRVEDDALVRLPGVGGTGVVTVSAILQMAAHLDGGYAAGLDQIGLAQKGGPVISDVRFSRKEIQGQLRASAASVDVILGFDLLGAADARTLEVADPERTVAVINTAITPTAIMVTNADAESVPYGHPIARLEPATRAVDNIAVNAEAIAERLLGDHVFTNMVLVGAAFQHGCLPVSREALEQAIRLNGTAVDQNLQAFHWGRTAVADPRALELALSSPEKPESPPVVPDSLRGADLGGDVVTLVAHRRAELVDYQNARYAKQYLDDVLELAGHDFPDRSSRDMLVTAYARYLYKFMAYKDEYEVARLHLLESERAKVSGQFGTSSKVKLLLHPPTLRAMGLKRKLRFGRAGFASLRLLRHMRRVRHTVFDPFGRSNMRRLERELIEEYRSLVMSAMQHLGPETLDRVADIIELPDLVRGYEHIKLRNVERFRGEADRQMALLRGPPTTELISNG